jgi:hypothetical protein
MATRKPEYLIERKRTKEENTIGTKVMFASQLEQTLSLGTNLGTRNMFVFYFQF